MIDPDERNRFSLRSVWAGLVRMPLMLLALLEGFAALLDRVAGSALRSVGKAFGDRFGEADSVFARVARGAAFPFRAIGRMLDGLFRILHVGQWMPFLGRLVWPLFYPIYAVGNFLVVLVSTRPRTAILWSLPLLVVVGPILFLVVRAMVVDRQVIANRYRQAVIQAIETRDLARAELFENKLVQLGVASQRYDYEAALRLEKDGQLDEAHRRMKLLGPEDQTGFGAAHFWLARNLLDGKLPVPREESLRLAGIHLRHSRTVGKDIPEIDYLFAVLEIRQGQIESALARLRKLQDRLLAAALIKLEIDLELRREADARVTSVSLLRLIQGQNDIEAIADDNLYRMWATAERLAGTHQGLTVVLGRWIRKYPDDIDAQSELSAIRLVELHRQMGDGSKIDVSQMTVRLLEAGRMVDPARREQLARLMEQLESKRGSDPDIAQVLENLEMSDDTPAVILEQMGTNAILKYKYSVAKGFLVRAVAKNPDDFVAWNNLAFLLNSQYAGEVDEALHAANNAVRLVSDNIQARETRGMILARMGRWQEAITDLEIAINGAPNSKNIHRVLGAAYRNVGNDLMADAHMQQAAQ